jgi:hypothetical protein
VFEWYAFVLIYQVIITLIEKSAKTKKNETN